MPGPSLTESRLFESVTAPPADGDDVAVSAGAAPFRDNFMQKMAARDSYLFNGPHHGFLDHVRAEVTASGTDRTWVLRGVRAFAAEQTDSSINRLSLGAGASLALTGLSASTWYYVYGFNNGGVIGLEASLTTPDGALRFSSGSGTRVYLGCFRTDTAGRAIPMVQNGRHYTFRDGFTGLSGTPLELGSTSGAPVAVDARVPPHVNVARVRFGTGLVGGAVSSTRSAGVRVVGDVNLTGIHQWRTTTSPEAHFDCTDIVVVGGQIELAGDAEVFVVATLLGFTE
ncbi:MAG: hypothetical protein JNK05_34980 [Myxococcales bacterium]|nr:hypothetical protein [Myxococcales bacterium]